ncbi:MAG: hypothetical protein A2W05_05905 [Candidatus Schekmanbacteria bacterium RBG_16_38_10]|uniref:Membrane protein 6-pyruvoyl-tetrahydropterin synthase-related domain-containing protein n=1 Tax=Candidatus Schekmanbacteria bacterium RBG_16_38_10 TaxID=1817879 RepID=A0A1F7RV63_9BACT|nr:MAG: hypothetical protein A2W05_05905 [Candidatus Schekmanbacteria bacterium RBG_16_38_10]
MNFKIKDNFLIFSAILIFASFIHSYFFQLLLLHNFNVFEYLRIIVEFNKNIQNGSLVPRWAPDFGNGYGTPFFIFNQSLGYYITEILYIISYDYFVAIKLSFFLVTFLSGLFAYLLSKEFSGKFSGLLFSFLYMILPYLSSGLNRSFTFSGFSALPWIPLVMWSFYKMQNCKKDKIKYLSLSSFSYALLIMSHGNISLIFLFALLFYIIFMNLYYKKRANEIIICFISLIIGISLSAFLWLPASYEKKYVQKHGSVPVWVKKISGKNPENRFTPLTGKAELMHEKFSPNEYFLRVKASEGASIRINIFYFPGWRAYVWDNNPKNTLKRKEIKIEHSNEYGLMDINIPSGFPIIDLIFTNTLIRWIADILSYCGVVALYFIYILTRSSK